MPKLATFLQILSLLVTLPTLSHAQGLVELAGAVTFATSVQKAVENGQYVFVAVIALLFLMQIAKAFFSYRYKSVRHNASQYSAATGTVVGGLAAHLTGSDPVSGSLGGMLAGNAASGLYSSLVKPLSRFVFPKILGGTLWYLPLILIFGVAAYFGIVKIVRKSPRQKRQTMLLDFDKAMAKVKDKENPSTLELEKWLTKQLE